MSIAGLLALLVWTAVSAAAAPEVEAIVRKLGEAAASPEIERARNSVSSERESRVDYLGGEGEVRKRVVRKYAIAPEDGQLVTRLVSVNGRAPTEKELEQRSSLRQTGDKSRSLTFSEELLRRYEFSLLGEETLGGRQTWMLRFKARPNAETDALFDRLLNAMAGIVWVDAEDFQVAKAELFLARKVSFFAGIAGAIDRLDLTLVQRRLEPNLWVAESTFIDFSGRKLFSDIRFRCYEKCSGFRRGLQAAAEP